MLVSNTGRGAVTSSSSSSSRGWAHRQPCTPTRPCLLRVRRAALPWDDTTTLSELQDKLDAAVQSEDYAAAARLRDTLQQKSSDSKLGVEDANRRFYDAFMSGRIQDMEAVWGQGEYVQIVHPLAGCIAGREQVMASWRTVLQGVRPRAFKIELEDVRIWANETSGFVTCVEVIDTDDSEGRIVATNIFEKQKGRWVITHHHGSPTRPR